MPLTELAELAGKLGTDKTGHHDYTPMFQLAFAGAPKHVILVGSESYTANNEYLISSAVGHRLEVALCRPDLPAGDRFSAASYHSDFTFDPAWKAEFLRWVLLEP